MSSTLSSTDRLPNLPLRSARSIFPLRIQSKMSIPMVVSGNLPSLVSAVFISTSALREAGSRHQIRQSPCLLEQRDLKRAEER